MKNYVTHNEDKSIEPWGTSLVGEVRCSYYDIVSLFGKPGKGDEYKIDAEWLIKFKDGVVATIYDWKTGIHYCGKTDGVAAKNQYDYNWHIGGKDQRAKEYVEEWVNSITYLTHIPITSKEELDAVKNHLSKFNIKSVLPPIKSYPLIIGVSYIQGLKRGTITLVKDPTTKETTVSMLLTMTSIDSILFDVMI